MSAPGSDWHRAYLASDPMNAEIVKDFLMGHGIEAEVRGDLLWGGRGELPADTGPSVWVSVAQHAQARELILRMEQGLSAASAWQCTLCAETLDGQFTHCWNCGQARE